MHFLLKMKRYSVKKVEKLLKELLKPSTVRYMLDLFIFATFALFCAMVSWLY